MGTDKNQLRKDAVLCSWTSSASRCLYNWGMAWPCWEVHGMLSWSISCALAPLKMFVLKISKGKNKGVFRAKLKICVSRTQGLKHAGKRGSLAISPPNTIPMAVSMPFVSGNGNIPEPETIVSWGPKEAENHLRAQRHKRGNHLTEIPRQAVSVTYYQQQSHKLSLKGSLSMKQKPKPYKLDVFKKNPGVIWEEVVSMKNMPPPPIFGRFYRSQDLRSISKPGAMSWCWL